MRQNDTALDFSLPSQIHKIFGLWLPLLYKTMRQIQQLHRETHHDIRAINHEEKREEGKNVGRKEIISRNNSRYGKKVEGIDCYDFLSKTICIN